MTDILRSLKIISCSAPADLVAIVSGSAFVGSVAGEYRDDYWQELILLGAGIGLVGVGVQGVKSTFAYYTSVKDSFKKEGITPHYMNRLQKRRLSRIAAEELDMTDQYNAALAEYEKDPKRWE